MPKARCPESAPSSCLAQPAIVNGAAGLIIAAGDRTIGVVGITVTGDRITEIDLITDPEKLRGIAPDHGGRP